MALVWNDSLVIGHSQIDREHRMLVDMVNEALQAVSQGGEGQVTLDRLAAIAAELDEHFNNEELIMDRFGYSYVSKHRDAHRELSRLINTLVRDATTRAAQVSVLELIASSLTDHIHGYDGLFSTFLKDNGCFGII